MESDDLKKFQNICLGVKKTFSDKAWDFDSRFNSLLIVFDRKWVDPMMRTLDDEFTEKWDSRSIKKASSAIKKLVKALYGIEPGQFIYSDENNDQDLAPYAAWWPWGNGDSVSLRISIYSPEKDLITETDIKNYLIEWFDL
jgi:hypothetical protein